MCDIITEKKFFFLYITFFTRCNLDETMITLHNFYALTKFVIDM